MDLNDREMIEDIVRVIYHARGGWRTFGGISRDTDIPSETVDKIVRNHPQFFIVTGDERAKYAIRIGGIDAVSLTNNARNWYLQEPVLSS